MSRADQKPLTSDFPHPTQPIGWDGNGVIRFKRNAIVRALLDECTERGGLDLNAVSRGVARGQFTNEDQIQLAQLIGYSVSGFGDLDYVPHEAVAAADEAAERISGASIGSARGEPQVSTMADDHPRIPDPRDYPGGPLVI